MTKVLTAILTIMMIALLCAGVASAEETVYTNESIVIGWEKMEYDSNVRVIIVLDTTGNEWAFYDDENLYQIGDIVILALYDGNGCKDELDEIIDTTLFKRLDEIGMINWMYDNGVI